jgi:molecular chaperone GrpE
MRDLLGVVDNIERALSVSTEEDSAGSLSEGVKMILNQMLSVLDRHGVKAFESVGEIFDPERHEAVARQGHAVHAADLVCEQMQKGYMLHDRLLRAASVVVSAGKLDSASDSSSNGIDGPEAES